MSETLCPNQQYANHCMSLFGMTICIRNVFISFCAGRGVLPDTSRGLVQRYTEKQLTHFIEFIQSPHITTDMPFGERKLKLSNGHKVIVPDIIRNIIPSRIVAQYLAYCNESIVADDFKPLASSSLFAILDRCSASMRKSLAGLDNFSCDGSTAFDQIRDLCDEMATHGKLVAKDSPCLFQSTGAIKFRHQARDNCSLEERSS